ncbi:hypothetical protein EVAR_84965_1 [Eumeta japonica]|uniref:Uncharacterized protein n=1 Tax=Eumeta variegata TaxID=151549 RepID=A0A4C1VFS4_EUMVA|nr:hypothetical protein EVAR_84965_1 [Eumeta japonica]
MVSDENRFSSTLLHARKSRANSEISELLTARRMDITVWMSSPNDEVPAVAAGSDTGGSRRTASPDGPGAALGGSVGFGLPHGLGGGARGGSGGWAFGHPYSWPYAAGDNSRRRVSPDSRVRAALSGPKFHAARVRMTVGGRVVVHLAAVALPWTSFLVWGLYRIPERPHTMFRLLNIFLASSVLGRTARTSHNGEPSLRQSLCTECTALAAETGAVCGYWRKLAPLRKKMGGGSLGLGGAVGLAPVLEAVLAVTACVEAETGFRVDSTGAVLVV